MKIREIKLDWVRLSRVLALIILDTVLVNAAALGALFIRFEFSFEALAESGFVDAYFHIAPYYMILSIGIFALLRLYSSLWRILSQLFHCFSGQEHRQPRQMTKVPECWQSVSDNVNHPVKMSEVSR